MLIHNLFALNELGGLTNPNSERSTRARPAFPAEAFLSENRFRRKIYSLSKLSRGGEECREATE